MKKAEEEKRAQEAKKAEEEKRAQEAKKAEEEKRAQEAKNTEEEKPPRELLHTVLDDFVAAAVKTKSEDLCMSLAMDLAWYLKALITQLEKNTCTPEVRASFHSRLKEVLSSPITLETKEKETEEIDVESDPEKPGD